MISPANPPVSVTNQLLNPSFVSGTYDGWDVRTANGYTTPSVVTDGVLGSYAGRLVVAATGGTVGHDYMFWSAEAGVNGGPVIPHGAAPMPSSTRASFSCWLKGSAGRGIAVRLVRDVGGLAQYSGGGGLDKTTSVNASGDWQWLSVTLDNYTS